MRFDKDKLKESLSIGNIKKILTELGSEQPKEDRQGNLMFQTICHGGNSHKLYYYEDGCQFHCYSNCNSMDIYEVVIQVKKQQGYTYSFPKAVEYVAKLSGKTFGFSTLEKVNQDIISDWDWLSRFERKDNKNVELPSYNENVLDVFLPHPHEDWINEGISYETMRKYEIGYYIRGEKISIPHRDVNNRLVGLRGRAMLQEDIDNGKKYMPLTIQNKLYNHPTMFNLYGINHSKITVNRLKKCLLFEGEKSVLKAEDMYGENNFTCAVCGSNISNWQRDIVLSLGVEEVFIAFDKFRDQKENETKEKYDEAVIDHQERLIKMAHKFSPYMRVYILWDFYDELKPKQSPIDQGQKVLESLMKTKYEVKTFME